MKAYHLIAVALFAAAVSTPAIAAKNASSSAYAFRVKEVVSGSGVVLPGTVRSEVLELLGTRASHLSENVWVYPSGFRSENLDAPNELGCTALVVTFARSRVADMKLVNPAAAKMILASAESGKPVRIVSEDRTSIAANMP